MPSKDIPIRFTEEKYATKSEVIKDLKMSTIDSFWNAIIEYRSNFFHQTQLTTIDKKNFVFCACPTINSNVSMSLHKLLKVNRSYSSLFMNPIATRYFETSSLSECLVHLGNKYKLDLDHQTAESLIRNEIEHNDDFNPIYNYLAALKYVKNAYINAINEDYIANLYSILMGTNELTSFYRTNEDRTQNNNVLINKMYACAPSNMIEDMMDSLFNFLASSTLADGVKAGIAYYYINYVRPFDSYSDEIAILVAKSILARDSLAELSIYFPFESLLSEDMEFISKLFTEVQKNSDLTYFVNYFINILNSNSDILLDSIAKINVQELRKDFFQEEAKELNIPDEPTIENETLAQVNETKNNESEVKETSIKEEIVISHIPVVIDEKRATLIEQDLLERDPSLKKGEAHFYARHCIKGKKYTIAQYKKSIGCVYETARTSMDHLAELGYYRKEKIKNKFVYVPISRN